MFRLLSSSFSSSSKENPKQFPIYLLLLHGRQLFSTCRPALGNILNIEQQVPALCLSGVISFLASSNNNIILFRCNDFLLLGTENRARILLLHTFPDSKASGELWWLYRSSLSPGWPNSTLITSSLDLLPVLCTAFQNINQYNLSGLCQPGLTME